MAGHNRVLVINGGGVRGIIPAKIIKKLVDDSGKQINELFDYVVGTSIGGIIAVSLTVKDNSQASYKGVNNKLKYTADDLVSIMENEAQYIFPEYSLGNWPVIGALNNLFYPKYSRYGIDKLLDDKLGDATFKDTIIPVTIVSYSLDKDQPRTWSTFKANLDDKYNYKLKDGAGATSAAPTYFPPKVTYTPTGEIYHDIDGGIFANSPTFLGISELINSNPEVDPSKIIVLSIGTGVFEDKIIAHDKYVPALNLPLIAATILSTIGSLAVTQPAIKYSSLTVAVGCGLTLIADLAKGFGQTGWVLQHDLIGKMMKGTELSDAIQSTVLFKSIRVNPKLESKYAELDKAELGHMKNFSEAVDMYIDNNPKIWDNIIGCLNSKDFLSVACAKARESQESKAEFQEIVGFERFIEEYTLVNTSNSVTD